MSDSDASYRDSGSSSPDDMDVQDLMSSQELSALHIPQQNETEMEFDEDYDASPEPCRARITKDQTQVLQYIAAISKADKNYCTERLLSLALGKSIKWIHRTVVAMINARGITPIQIDVCHTGGHIYSITQNSETRDVFEDLWEQSVFDLPFDNLLIEKRLKGELDLALATLLHMIWQQQYQIELDTFADFCIYMDMGQIHNGERHTRVTVQQALEQMDHIVIKNGYIGPKNSRKFIKGRLDDYMRCIIMDSRSRDTLCSGIIRTRIEECFPPHECNLNNMMQAIGGAKYRVRRKDLQNYFGKSTQQMHSIIDKLNNQSGHIATFLRATDGSNIDWISCQTDRSVEAVNVPFTREIADIPMRCITPLQGMMKCPCCHDTSVTKQFAVLQCKHVACCACLETIFTSANESFCPICRNAITEPQREIILN